MGKIDVFVGILILVFCAVAYWLSRGFPPPEAVVGDLGPAFFPQLIILGMAILGGVILIQGLVTTSRGARIVDLGPKEVRTPAMLLVLVGVYLVLLPLLGFMLSTPLFLIGSMFIWRVSMGRALGISLSVTILLWILFKIFLRVPLSTGIIWGG